MQLYSLNIFLIFTSFITYLIIDYIGPNGFFYLLSKTYQFFNKNEKRDF